MTDAPERLWIQSDHIQDEVALNKWTTEPDADEAYLFTEYAKADPSTYDAGFAAGIEAAARKVENFAKAIGLDAEAAMDNHPQIGEDRAEYADDARDVAKEIRALAEQEGE